MLPDVKKVIMVLSDLPKTVSYNEFSMHNMQIIKEKPNILIDLFPTWNNLHRTIQATFYGA